MTYTVRTHAYEGPLGVLLDLITERKLIINTISLAEVTQGYFMYLEALKSPTGITKEQYGEMSEFLRIAATLILIKSKSLLPGFHLSSEEERDVSDLEDRLNMYQRMRELALVLGERYAHPRPVYLREPFIGVVQSFIPPRIFDLASLPDIMEALLGAIPSREQLPEKKVREIVSLEDKIQELRVRIERGFARSFAEFVGKNTDHTNIIVSFLALLELIKVGVVSAHQEEKFGRIAMHAPTEHTQ
ncbi:MAG: segregation/condensation protein A [Patescibacteria group bacterium]